MKIAYDNQTFELDVTIRQECDIVEAVEVTNDFIVVRPKDDAKLRQTLVPRSEYDYRVLSRPIGGIEESGPLVSKEDTPTPQTRDDLMRLSVAELQSLAREAGLIRYSRLRKQGLVDALSTEPAPSPDNCT